MEASKEDILATKPDCLAGGGIEAKAETIGINKTNMEPARVFMLSIMAGMQIGMGALFMTFVKADQSLGFAASSVLGGFCFALGLICVIVAGAELFTGNSLMIIAKASDKISWAALLKNWGLVWVGNLVGSLLLVGIITGCGLMGTQTFASAETVNTIGDQMVKIASAKMSLDAGQIIFRGIMCNLLVCLAVWMGFAGRTVIDKIFTTIFPVMAFVAMGFEHCVANMFFLPMGIIASNMGFGAGALAIGGAIYNILLATIGNIIGGAVFVGLIYWFSYRSK
ncbi:MAG: formate/nitrite transporter family protein [Coriobacteriales bacterium]|nr:formate/nitrite transporter family protein [Coriobacteriales bacterium]